ncbi:hypothetical protein K502DRAFT_348625 [Neoconidiobolus thromboides FSU 785]|nr:hypothetical protein K502DRAFT_348625 [Neoconidiobolus thromboides FSU 785]
MNPLNTLIAKKGSLSTINNKVVEKLARVPLKYDWKKIEDSRSPNSQFSYYLPACSADLVRIYLELNSLLVKTDYFTLKAIPWNKNIETKDKKIDINLTKYRVSFIVFKKLVGKLKVKRSQICRKGRAAATIMFPLYAPLRCDYLLLLNENVHTVEWSRFLDSIQNALIEIENKINSNQVQQK